MEQKNRGFEIALKQAKQQRAESDARSGSSRNQAAAKKIVDEHKIRRNTSTPELRASWQLSEEIAAEVAAEADSLNGHFCMIEENYNHLTPIWQVQLESKDHTFCFEIAAYEGAKDIALEFLKSQGFDPTNYHLGGYASIGHTTIQLPRIVRYQEK